MQAVDLHVHSSRSDGSLTPAQLVDYAMEKGLKAFALTDHDTVDGLDEATGYAEAIRNGQKDALRQNPDSRRVPEVIPGIEFSTEYQGHDIHIVGLYIDYHHPAFRQRLQEFVDSRITRNRKMCRLLQEAGIPVSYEDLLAEFPDAVITRAHYAKYMLGHGYTRSLKEAFDKYVGDHCPCFVPREKVTPVQAVQLILENGGVPVLAHPALYPMSAARLDKLTGELAKNGLIGLEAVYSTYSPAEERQMRSLAARHGLLVSGGSDFHGSAKPGLDLGTGYGKLFVPEDILENIRQRARGPVSFC